MDTALTQEQFAAALPPGMQKNVNPLLMVRINNILTDPEEAEMLKENLVDYAYVLSQGKFKMSNYVDAVRYVGFRVMDMNIKESYRRTFPEKVKQFQVDGVSEKTISSYASAWNKSKLVNLIFEQTLVPCHILNNSAFQSAINTQVRLMTDPKQSGMVQSNAANSLMTHLKPPEAKKVELDIGPVVNTISQDYQKSMAELVQTQLDLIQKGGNLHEITNAPIVRQEDKDGAFDV